MTTSAEDRPKKKKKGKNRQLNEQKSVKIGWEGPRTQPSLGAGSALPVSVPTDVCGSPQQHQSPVLSSHLQKHQWNSEKPHTEPQLLMKLNLRGKK